MDYSSRRSATKKPAKLRNKRRKRDPLLPIANRLFPLVQQNLDWWREGVRRWARKPPRYHVGPDAKATRNTKELRADLLRRSQQQGQRHKNESDADWARRQARIAIGRKSAAEQLRKLGDIKDGCVIRGVNSAILPVPFPGKPITPDERIALLAAIHDSYADGIAQVDPWNDRKKLADTEIATPERKAHLAAVPYDVLLNARVPALRRHWKKHGAKIAEFITEIEHRLAELAKRPSDSKTATLFEWARVNLKGKQLRIIEKLIENSQIPLADLAIDSQIDWGRHYENPWGCIRKALNCKLKDAHLTWRVSTRSRNACLREIGQK